MKARAEGDGGFSDRDVGGAGRLGSTSGEPSSVVSLERGSPIAPGARDVDDYTADASRGWRTVGPEVWPGGRDEQAGTDERRGAHVTARGARASGVPPASAAAGPGGTVAAKGHRGGREGGPVARECDPNRGNGWDTSGGLGAVGDSQAALAGQELVAAVCLVLGAVAGFVFGVVTR